MCTQHASNYKLKIYFKKIKWKFFPKSTLSASIHSTVYGWPTSCRKWTSKKTKYRHPWDVRRRRLKDVAKGEVKFHNFNFSIFFFLNRVTVPPPLLPEPWKGRSINSIRTESIRQRHRNSYDDTTVSCGCVVNYNFPTFFF